MANQWQDFCTSLQSLGNELLSAAPDEQTRTEGVAYLARLAAGAIQRNLMGAERLTNGIDFNQPRIGGYNPDYRLGVANVLPGQRYRLTGQVNDAYRLGLGIYSLAPDGGMVIDDYRALMSGKPGLEKDGTFDLQIGPTATPDTGLRSLPATNVFIMREILLKQGGKRADIALVPVSSGPVTPAALSVEGLARDMLGAQQFFTGALKQFLGWSNIFATQTNTIVPLLPELDKKVQGDPGTSYYTGYYNLRDDQALVIEIPDMSAEYWAIMLANHWQEPLPASYLNHVTAKKEADGVTRIIVASRDPGHANWLSTAGRTRGVIWHRRINADNRENPRCTLRG
jgi:Protein of unknown function (DUF1254)